MINYEDFNHKRILISGATGMIASQIIVRLLQIRKEQDFDLQIIALYRDEQKKDRVFAEYLQNSSISWIRSDISEPIFINGSVDYIIHTAGVTGGSKQHIDKPMKTISTALEGTINILELAREKKVEGMVYLSSLEIYGLTDFTLPSIKESDGGYLDCMAVRSSYSESKRMCETICASYAKQYGVPVKVVRLAPTYGAGASYTDGRVLCEFARCILERKDIVLHTLGDTVRNYCDVSDAVSAILFVLFCGETGQAYNIANMNISVSIKELADRFIELYPEAEITVRYDLSENVKELGYNETRKVLLNSEKLQELGWSPQVDADGMIRNLVEAMRESSCITEED